MQKWGDGGSKQDDTAAVNGYIIYGTTNTKFNLPTVTSNKTKQNG